MDTVLCFVVGLLVSVAVYCMLSRNIMRFMYGLLMLSNAANLIIFLAGRINRGFAPIIGKDVDRLVAPYTNPLPQALILTAIVISFALFAFALVLTYRAYRGLGTINTDAMRTAEPVPASGHAGDGS